jgi:hypothetical protein
VALRRTFLAIFVPSEELAVPALLVKVPTMPREWPTADNSSQLNAAVSKSLIFRKYKISQVFG